MFLSFFCNYHFCMFLVYIIFRCGSQVQLMQFCFHLPPSRFQNMNTGSHIGGKQFKCIRHLYKSQIILNNFCCRNLLSNRKKLMLLSNHKNLWRLVMLMKLLTFCLSTLYLSIIFCYII